MFSEGRILLQVECVIEELSICCCNEDGQTKTHIENIVVILFRGLRRQIEDVGGVDEEFNGMNSDEYTQEVQFVFESISAAEFDPRLLRELRQTEIAVCVP